MLAETSSSADDVASETNEVDTDSYQLPITSTYAYNGLFEQTVLERPTVMVAVENSNSCGR